jgi:hypothetical protein
MSQERVQRRLEAILFGYSRLTGQDEVGTWRRLQSVLQNVVRPQVKAHAGRIIRIKGDGILVEFLSAVDAVATGVALQQAMAERNATLADAQRIELRIGINLGDIITNDHDIQLTRSKIVENGRSRILPARVLAAALALSGRVDEAQVVAAKCCAAIPRRLSARL